MYWGAAACGWNKLGPLGRALVWGEKERQISNAREQGHREARFACIRAPVQAMDGPEGLMQDLLLGSPRPDSPPT